MMPLRTATTLFLCLATVVSAEPPRTDRHGDPLPADALVRFGTTRLRHGGAVASLAFLPEQKGLVSAAGDNTLRLWELATGKELRRITLPADEATMLPALAVSPDGKLLAVPAGDKLRFWDAASGKELPAWDKKGDHTFGGVVFAPDGKTLAVNFGNTVGLWDVAKRQQVRELKVLRNAGAVEFSADSKLVAVGDGDVIRIWEAAAGKQLHRLTRHRARVTSVAFAPDGKTLASVGDDNTVRLWDLAGGEEVRQLDHPNTRPASQHFVFDGRILTSAGVVFLPDGRSLLSTVKGDRFIRQWETATGKELRRFEGHPDGTLCIALSADGHTLAAAGEDNCIRLWDVATGKDLAPPEGHRARIWNAGLSPDGKIAYTASRDNTIRAWDAATGQEVRRFGDRSNTPALAGFTADGRLMAAARHDDEIIQLWDLAAGKVLRELEAPHSGIASVAFTRDGKTLVSLDNEETVCHWEVATGKKLREWKANPPEDGQRIRIRYGGAFKPIACSPDGKLVATSGFDFGNQGGDTVHIWDAETGKHVRKIETGQQNFNFIFRILFSPDGHFLAVAGRDNSVTFWSVATGVKLHTIGELGFQHPLGMINLESITFSPDGRLLAAAGPNSTVVLVETITGTEVRRIPTGQGWVSAMAFAADSRTLLVGGLDTTALLLDVTGRPGAPKELTEDDLAARWADLLDGKGQAAYRGVWQLAATPAQAVPFLRKQLHPVAPVEAARLQRLITDLESDQFPVRKKAQNELEKLGELADAALRKALEGQPTLDVKQQIEDILKKRSDPRPIGEQLRMLRAIAALEQATAPEARQLLEELAKGVAEARLTQEARAALERQRRRAGE